MTKEERRKLMPWTTAIIDDLREQFGPNAIVMIKAKENGQVIKWEKR